jgi:hypothetical protein
LPWKVEEIVRGLDEGRFTYQDLMFRMCLVGHDEIGEDVPVEWNHLETHVPGRTALTHFTVVPTQPWKTDATPLNELWMAAYEEAVAAGAVDPADVRRGVEQGYYKKGLLPALAKAPAFWNWKPAGAAAAPAASADARLELAQREVERLRQELASLRSSWTWRVGRLVTRPLALFAKGARTDSASG